MNRGHYTFPIQMFMASYDKAHKALPERVFMRDGEVVVDLWCDGNEQEAERVVQLTRGMREARAWAEELNGVR